MTKRSVTRRTLPQTLPTLLSVPWFARETGVCTKTVERQIKAGKLRAVRIGRRVLVPAEELSRLSNGGRPA